MSKLLKVFITYSHQDTDAKDKLIECLAVMKQKDMITTWHDNEILPGDKWREAISNNLTDSDILLYLISASSLDSKNCNKELGDALDFKIRVIPIILESCDWQNHQLSDIQALPDKGKSINEWEPESKAWQNVVEGIRKVVDEMRDQPKHSPQTTTQEETKILAYLTLQQGNFLMTLKQIDRAIEVYSHAIQLDTHYVDAYINCGVAYGIKGELDQAIADYNKAIELNPDYATAYSNRGVVYSDKGEHDRAIVDYNKAIELNPHYVDAYSNRGIAYGAKDEHDRAIVDYNKAIELDPQFALAYSNRGIAYGIKGELDQAIEDFTKAIELNPDHASAYNNRGNIYSAKDEHDRAIEDFTKAIELNPQFTLAYSNRGIDYGAKGEHDRAIVDYNKAIELDPHYVDAYSNRGIAYGIKGELDQAIEDFTKAIGLDPQFTLAYSNRGIAYGIKGELDQAIEDFTKAIELNPQFALAYTKRSMCWLHLQNWQEAKSDLIIAKNMGIDIIAAFRDYYRNVEAFERMSGVQLPEDIASMLTQRRRTRFYKTENFLKDDDTIPKSFESLDVLNLREKLRNAGTPLVQYVKIRPHFGIKTDRDDAFVVDSMTRDKLIEEHPSSADLLKPFLHGRDIRRWQVEAQDLWLIFAYRGIEINSYPAIQKHLEKYRDSLSERAGEQEWYELQVPFAASERFTQTKLVCPNLYNHKTFAVEADGFYCGHTCYLIPTEETWLCGVLNSRVVEWFYSQESNQLTGRELRALSSYMQQIPIPDITSTQKRLIGKIVDYLIYLQKQPTTNSKDLAYARDYVMLKYFERIIDGLAYESYLPEELHQSGKYFFKPLMDEQFPQTEEIQGDKISAFRDIFEHLYEKTYPVRKNLFFLDSLKPIRIIEGKV